MSYLHDSPNINNLWASLMVEECVRLGLSVRLFVHISFLTIGLHVSDVFLVQYFCIAPGSRSSPLTLAASAHPLTTCVVCIDERSLSFNALGYARGSHRPAVVITTSGTAVSNLLSAVSLISLFSCLYCILFLKPTKVMILFGISLNKMLSSALA